MFQAMAIGSYSCIAPGAAVNERTASVPRLRQAFLSTRSTVNAARSVNAADDIGAIRPGMKADLTVIDLNKPAMRPVIWLLGLRTSCTTVTRAWSVR